MRRYKLGSAAFSRAVQALDLQTGMLVCVKIIKNNKDFFDQSLDGSDVQPALIGRQVSTTIP